MQTFHLDPQKASLAMRRAVIIYAVLGVISMIAVYFSIRDNITEKTWLLVLAIVALYFVSGWQYLRNRKLYWETFKLEFQEDSFTRSAHRTETVTIERFRFGGFREIRDGLVISTKANRNALFIPDDFTDQDYQAIKQIFESWTAAGD